MLAPWHRFLWQMLSQILRLFSRQTAAGIKPGSPGSLTNVILQANLQLGPQHDESKGGIEVDIVGVVHPVLLAWKDRGDSEGWETCHREGKVGAGPPSHTAQEGGLFAGTGKGSL